MLHSAVAPGPVRDLQCRYDPSRTEALWCEWTEPEQTADPVQSYQVNIIHDGVVIWQNLTTALTFSTNEKLIRGEIYIVSMRALTHLTGPTAETRVIFLDSGEPKHQHFQLCLCRYY